VFVDPVPALDREWQQLARASLPARLRAWSLDESALAPFAEPERLIRFLRGPASAKAKDELLRPLLRIARDEPLAARVVLHALMPGLKRLSARALLDTSEWEELWELLLAHAWERIRRYPLARRPRRIAANILLDTLHRTLRELERERRRRRRGDGEASLPASIPDQRAEIARLLRDAVSAGALSQLEARIIFAARIERSSLTEIAGEEGLAYNVLRVRLQRAERRLLLYLGHPGVPNRRTKGPLSSARVIGATHTDRINRRPKQAG
jgi:DNA-directed RNA polymerase specialized sigma24 family protein